MYAGIAAGAPLGIGLYHSLGVQSVFTAIIILAVLGWLATLRLPMLAANPAHARTPFYKVIGTIAGQGMGLALSSIGFACISSFIVLYFKTKGWGEAAAAFASFGSAYVLVRVFCASFPDRFGGYRVALFSLVVEIAGQLCIWSATSGAMAIAGCILTGAGFSLIFPSLGVLAVKKVSSHMRGTALGAYVAFFDLSLGIAGPIAGLIASRFNYAAVYLFGAISALAAMVMLFIKRKQ
ncbi:MAG: MFS transporter [Filimonas sp.]|nr:MFS transporter [Filimonas sp.]